MTHWSNRLLTADTVNHLLFLSKKDKPSELDHHKIRVTYVELWPYVDPALYGEHLHSTEAQLTVRVEGYIEDVTTTDKKNLAHLDVVPRTQPIPIIPDEMRKAGKMFWILRCHSLSALEELVSIFYQMNIVSLNETPAISPHSTDASRTPKPLSRVPSATSLMNRETREKGHVDLIVTIKGSILGIKEKSAKVGNSAVKKEKKEFQ